MLLRVHLGPLRSGYAIRRNRKFKSEISRRKIHPLREDRTGVGRPIKSEKLGNSVFSIPLSLNEGRRFEKRPSPRRQSLPASSTDQRSKERHLMITRTGQQQSDNFLTIRNAWMEGKAPMPSDPVSIFETNFNNLLGLFLGRGTSILLGPAPSARLKAQCPFALPWR
jgi:hypothetical protein